MKENKEIIRKDDFVRINNPYFFLRCGYPLTMIDIENEIQEKHMSKIDELFKSFEIKDHNIRKRSYYEVIRAVAYEILRTRKFGGKERRIYTHCVPSLLNRPYKVSLVKTCVTGNYVASSGNYSSWSEEYEYEQAYLEDQKSHRILYLTYLTEGDVKKYGNLLEWKNNNDNWDNDFQYSQDFEYGNKNYPMAIESCNVKKIIIGKENNNRV